MAAVTVDTVADMVAGHGMHGHGHVTAVTGWPSSYRFWDPFYVGGSCYRTMFTTSGPRHVYVCNRYF